MVYDMAETGVRCGAGLNVVKQGQEHVVVRGEEGENNSNALRLFLEEGENIGEAMVAEMSGSSRDAEGEEVRD